MHLTAEAAPRDAGFTLIELLVAILITSVVALPLGDALIGYFQNTDATSARMALSHDAQISAAYFAGDVAAVGLRDFTTTGPGGTIPFKSSIQKDAAFDAGGQVCGTSATPVAKVRLLADDWDNTTTPPTQNTRIVAYYLSLPPSGTVSELHRLVCDGGTTTDNVLAHDVDPSAAFTVSCGNPTTCESTTVPQTVTITFSVKPPTTGCDSTPRPPECEAPYQITLTGQRRQQ